MPQSLFFFPKCPHLIPRHQIQGQRRKKSATPVLRITQLDALELDSSLEQLVWTQFSQCFQNFRPGILTPVEPELRTLLHLLLWRFTLYSKCASVGQSLLNLHYHNTLFLQQGLRCLTLVSGIAQLANLVNFLIFIRKGRHPVLAERIVGAQAVSTQPNMIRDIDYQFMNRELLWHGFAEFLIFLLPLINTRKLKATVSSFVFGGDRARGEGTTEGQQLWKECGLCGEWPTMPHTVGCRHVFCYYCIKSHSIADTCLTCPKCGAEAGQPQPVKMNVEMTEM
uniref:Peroxisome biogenesis factor 2 n=1 Tax=Cynoglossus semilaevis TaxID=244447 RepID=A0A3P8VF40_CYNSE